MKSEQQAKIFGFIGCMSGGWVGRKAGWVAQGWHFRKGAGKHTQMEFMELAYRSRFNYNQQVNSASGNNG